MQGWKLSYCLYGSGKTLRLLARKISPTALHILIISRRMLNQFQYEFKLEWLKIPPLLQLCLLKKFWEQSEQKFFCLRQSVKSKFPPLTRGCDSKLKNFTYFYPIISQHNLYTLIPIQRIRYIVLIFSYQCRNPYQESKIQTSANPCQILSRQVKNTIFLGFFTFSFKNS